MRAAAATLIASLGLCILCTCLYGEPLRLRAAATPPTTRGTVSNSNSSLIESNSSSNATNMVAVSEAVGPTAAAPAGDRALLLRVYKMTLFQLATTAAVASLVATLLVPEDVEGYIGCRSTKRRLFQVMATEAFVCLLIALLFGTLSALYIHRFEEAWAFRLFGLLAVQQGLFVGLVCAWLPRQLVAAALAATAGLFAFLAALSLFLAARGVDLGWLEPCLAEVLVVFLAGAVLRRGCGLEPHLLLKALGGVALFAGYIIVDSHRIAYRYADEEYVWGSVEMYYDVLNLFLELLEFLGELMKS